MLKTRQEKKKSENKEKTRTRQGREVQGTTMCEKKEGMVTLHSKSIKDRRLLRFLPRLGTPWPHPLPDTDCTIAKTRGPASQKSREVSNKCKGRANWASRGGASARKERKKRSASMKGKRPQGRAAVVNKRNSPPASTDRSGPASRCRRRRFFPPRRAASSLHHPQRLATAGARQARQRTRDSTCRPSRRP